MLPSYQRIGGSGGGLSGGTSSSFFRRSFRNREKCLILMVFLTLGFICFGGFFYLPDNFGTVYKQFQKTGPEIFIPAPPRQHAHGGAISDVHQSSGELPPRRAIGDRAKLHAKIREEEMDILEKPETANNGGGGGGAYMGNDGGGEAPIMNPPSPEQRESADNSAVGKAPFAIDDAATTPRQLTFVNMGEDSDPTTRQRRDKVKEVSFYFIFTYLFSNFHVYIFCVFNFCINLFCVLLNAD